MGIIEDIKQLATTIGTDIKSLREQTASKEDVDKALTLLDGIASAVRKSEVNEEFKNSLLSKAIVKAIGDKQTIPFKEINESNFNKFVEFIAKNVSVKNTSNDFYGRTFITLRDNQTSVVIRLIDDLIAKGYKLKIVYTKNGETTEVVTDREFTIIDPTECKYYIFKNEDVVESEPYTVYLKELEKHNNALVEMKEETNGSVTVTKVVDNNDYDVYDLTNHGAYIVAIEKQFRQQFPNKDYSTTDINFSYEKIEINGNIKILRFHLKNSNLEPKLGIKGKVGYGNAYYFKNNPKYLSVYGINVRGRLFDVNRRQGIVSNTSVEGKNNANTYIAQFDSEGGNFKRYTGITRDSLEDWLKAHPLETL